MARERQGFRENLADILAFTEGRRFLSVGEVRQYLGLSDNRTVKKYFPAFKNGHISAATLAVYLAGGEPA